MKYLFKGLLFVGGIFLLATGIVFSSVAGIGIAPPSAPAYAFNELIDLGVGNYIIILNFIYVFVQLIILRTRFKRFQFMQLFFGFVLGGFITFVTPLLANLPVNTMTIIIYSLVSVTLISFGVALIILGDFVYSPLEGMQKVIADELGVPLAKVKVPIDLLHVLLALAVVPFAKEALEVIGIGTVFQAFAVGICLQFFLNKLSGPIKKVI